MTRQPQPRRPPRAGPRRRPQQPLPRNSVAHLSLRVSKSYAGETRTYGTSRPSPGDPSTLLVAVHVKPGSRVERVGGSHDGALVVRVRARAVDQSATTAALGLLARAFGLRPSAIHLERGATSRAKVVALIGDVGLLAQR